MSRSRRKTPVRGTTTCKSEKQEKRLINRMIRRISKSNLNRGWEPIWDANEVMNPWHMGKDGKTRFDPAEYPNDMRK